METIFEADENKENVYIEARKKIFIAASQRKIFGLLQGQSAPSNPPGKVNLPIFEIYEDLESKTEEIDPAQSEATRRKAHLWSEGYVPDHHDFLRTAELKYRPRSDILKRQPNVDEKMRAVLVNCLVLVSVEHRLQPETLHLAVSYIDRVLSKHAVGKTKFQLLGVTCLMIANKFEEVPRLRLRDFAKVADKDTLLKMEELVFELLDFDLYKPTSIDFLRIYCYASGFSSMVKYLAMYICELGLLVPCPHLPSCVAASAIALARHTLDTREKNIWPRKAQKFSGYVLEDLKDCVNTLEKLYKKELPLNEIKKKYAGLRYNRVSHIFPRRENVFG